MINSKTWAFLKVLNLSVSDRGIMVQSPFPLSYQNYTLKKMWVHVLRVVFVLWLSSWWDLQPHCGHCGPHSTSACSGTGEVSFPSSPVFALPAAQLRNTSGRKSMYFKDDVVSWINWLPGFLPCEKNGPLEKEGLFHLFLRVSSCPILDSVLLPAI